MDSSRWTLRASVLCHFFFHFHFFVSLHFLLLDFDRTFAIVFRFSFDFVHLFIFIIILDHLVMAAEPNAPWSRWDAPGKNFSTILNFMIF